MKIKSDLKIICGVCLIGLMFATNIYAEPSAEELLEMGRKTLNKDRVEGKKFLEKSIVKFKQKLTKNPQDKMAAHSIGKAYFYLENDIMAAKYYDKAIKIDNKMPAPYFMKGLIFSYAKNYKKAILNFKKACELSPKTSKYWYEYGRALSNDKQTQKAIKAYRKTISLNDKDKHPLYNIGVIYFEQKNIKKL